jgi:8-oxo-dGTP diphosphatase
VHLGETVRAAAVREVREEIGIDVRLGTLLDVVDFVSATHHYVLVDFWAQALSDNLTAGDDAAEARWVSQDELHTIDLWDATRAIIAQAFAAREMDTAQ